MYRRTFFSLVFGDWAENVLYSFDLNGNDGNDPYSTLIFDAAGNLYGTTIGGGAVSAGTVFELMPTTGGNWTEKVLHSFGKFNYGAYPYAGLIIDAAGNLYGMTQPNGNYSFGTVFELTPLVGGNWTDRVLHNFSYSTTFEGLPLGGLVFDSAGHLYGATAFGGAYGYGSVFEITP